MNYTRTMRPGPSVDQRPSLLGSLGRIRKKTSCRRALSPARILSRQSCGGNRLFVWLRFPLALRPSDFCLNGKNSQQLSLGEAWAVGVGGRKGAPPSGQRPWRSPLPTWRQAGRKLVVTLVEVIASSLSALTFTTCHEMGIIDPIFTEQIRLNKLPKLPSYHVVGWRIFPTSVQGQEMTQPWGEGTGDLDKA